jgi:PTH1 family peptidyl-tRNA hydrolase
LQKEKISQDNLLVVTDDIALPFGVLRLKGKGSDGGHNGLKNIQEVFGNSSYARLRFGVGNDFFKGQQVNFVLGKWSEQEMEHLVPRVEKSVEIIRSFVSIGIQLTMTNYNNK